MTRQELDKLRQPWPLMFAAALEDAGCATEPEYVEDEYGCYSTGYFRWKGKTVIITIDGGLWHLSVSANHTLGYYELKELRYTFLPNDMPVAQIFPKREDFVNVHENCFHLWQLAPERYDEYRKEGE